MDTAVRHEYGDYLGLHVNERGVYKGVLRVDGELVLHIVIRENDLHTWVRRWKSVAQEVRDVRNDKKVGYVVEI
jgi:hypothetical protein